MTRPVMSPAEVAEAMGPVRAILDGATENTLRAAAERLRDPYLCNTNRWDPALADWLDLVASLLGQGFDPNAETLAALTCARAVLGGAS